MYVFKYVFFIVDGKSRSIRSPKKRKEATGTDDVKTPKKVQIYEDKTKAQEFWSCDFILKETVWK